MADESAVAKHVVPRLTKAADGAGRPAPRVVAGSPVCLREVIAGIAGIAAELR